MGSWTVDVTTEPGVLRVKLVGKFSVEDMTSFVDEHNRAIDNFGRRDYRVWVDLTELAPLSQECTEIIEKAKRHSSSKPNFRGSAVLVNTPTIALQHRRTSVEAGVMATELISSDPAELREHLRKVNRRPGDRGVSSPDLGHPHTPPPPRTAKNGK
ncbi:MAG: hypothetical protein HOW73_01105 [Polyangiaceae bacterium]|nr:hypothetical protein [Polyangiaceae bacterium]